MNAADEAIPYTAGRLVLRPEADADLQFRWTLFLQSRPQEWAFAQLEPHVLRQIMEHQFHAQTTSYRAAFPQASFDIIELDGKPIGRIVVNRPGDGLHLIDQAVVPMHRNKGVGSALMRALQAEAVTSGVKIRLQVNDGNDPAKRFYDRFGFAVTVTAPMYLEMEWPAPRGI